MINLDNITRENISFDWKNCSFEQFIERLKLLVKGKNRFKFTTKSQYWCWLGIIDTKNWKMNLLRSNDGELKLLLLLCMFSDEEQTLINILVEDDIITRDSVRISIDRILTTQFNVLYSAENQEVTDNNLIDMFKDRFELTIKKTSKLD